MAAVEAVVRDLANIQLTLVRAHALLAGEPMAAGDRHRVDSYFDAFASNLTGLEEYLRSMSSTIAS